MNMLHGGMVHGHCLYLLAIAQDIPAGSHADTAVHYDVVTSVLPVLTGHLVPESVAPDNDIFQLILVEPLRRKLPC